MHARVVAMAREGKTGQQILDQFVRENGVAILMAPPKRGFNLAGYFVPSLVIVVAGAILTHPLRRWARAVPAPVAPRPSAAAATPGRASPPRRGGFSRRAEATAARARSSVRLTPLIELVAGILLVAGAVYFFLRPLLHSELGTGGARGDTGEGG